MLFRNPKNIDVKVNDKQLILEEMFNTDKY